MNDCISPAKPPANSPKKYKEFITMMQYKFMSIIYIEESHI